MTWMLQRSRCSVWTRSLARCGLVSVLAVTGGGSGCAFLRRDQAAWTEELHDALDARSDAIAACYDRTLEVLDPSEPDRFPKGDVVLELRLERGRVGMPAWRVHSGGDWPSDADEADAAGTTRDPNMQASRREKFQKANVVTVVRVVPHATTAPGQLVRCVEEEIKNVTIFPPDLGGATATVRWSFELGAVRKEVVDRDAAETDDARVNPPGGGEPARAPDGDDDAV